MLKLKELVTKIKSKAMKGINLIGLSSATQTSFNLHEINRSFTDCHHESAVKVPQKTWHFNFKDKKEKPALYHKRARGEIKIGELNPAL